MTKNHLKSPEFYKEANQMSKGWGTRLRHMDLLKNKKANFCNLSLNEFGYIMWLELHCMDEVDSFIKHCKSNKIDKKKPYECWSVVKSEFLELKNKL